MNLIKPLLRWNIAAEAWLWEALSERQEQLVVFTFELEVD